jgi:hypothetical protein
VSARPAGAYGSARVLERNGDTGMPNLTGVVIGGVDPHPAPTTPPSSTSKAAAGDREFAADSSGYQQLRSWLGRHGRLAVVGWTAPAATARA